MKLVFWERCVDYSSLRSLTARELIAALTRDGFHFVRQSGSHQRYAHSDGRRVTVAPHGRGDAFTIKTLKSMIGLQAQWTEDDLVRLGLVKK
jgi:predicted RNA binding protein YcfA (HicA-like mRNA interferase family)